MAHTRSYLYGGTNLNIAYASDDNFVDVMLVSIMSFNDHNSDATIYILDCGITEQNKQKILELCSGKNAVLFVDAKKKLSEIDHKLNLDRGSIAAYARLFIGTVLSSDVKRVIYLDADTLIRKSLEELFETSTDQYCVAGIKDAFSVCNKKVFNISKGELMINSGVLLINLDMWRHQKVEDRIVELISKKKKVFQGDQGIINTVFHGRVKELPLKYDVMAYLYDFTYKEIMLYRKPDNYFDENAINEAISNPAIVHFTTSFRSYRPWEIGESGHPYFEEWRNYYLNTGASLRKNDRRIVSTPNHFFLLMVGVLHAYIRPSLYMMGINS